MDPKLSLFYIREGQAAIAQETRLDDVVTDFPRFMNCAPDKVSGYAYDFDLSSKRFTYCCRERASSKTVHRLEYDPETGVLNISEGLARIVFKGKEAVAIAQAEIKSAPAPITVYLPSLDSIESWDLSIVSQINLI